MKNYKIFAVILVILALMSVGAAQMFRQSAYFLETVDFKKNVTFNSTMKTTYGNGAGVTGATATEYSDGLHKTVVTFNKSITMTDSAGTGSYGSFKFYDAPAGAIEILGVVANLHATSAGSPHGLVAAADGDFSIGTAACNAGSLTGTEADIVASTALAQFANTAGVITGQNAAVTYHDGTTTAKDLYLNVIFDDADSSTNDTLTVTGTATIFWINRGDY